MTTKVDKTIEVDVPVSTAYNQWTQFESFPEFMGGVSEVRQLDDRRMHWVAQIAGVKREWDAEVVDQVPDSKVAWAATEGATNAGAVYFEPLGADRTLVRLSLEYAPEGLVEKVGDALDVVGRRAEADLEKFKGYIEAKGVADGAWRGSVAGPAGTPGVADASGSHGDDGKAGVSGTAVAAGVAAAAVGAAVAGAAVKKAHSDDDGLTQLPPATGDATTVDPSTVHASTVDPSTVDPVLGYDPLEPTADEPVPGPFTVEPGIGTDRDDRV